MSAACGMIILQIGIPQDRLDDLGKLCRTDTFPVGTANGPSGRDSPFIHIMAQADLTEYGWHVYTHLDILLIYCKSAGKRLDAEVGVLSASCDLCQRVPFRSIDR